MNHSKRINISAMVQCSLFAALLCMMSPVTFPVGPVPVSMGNFAVMLCAVVLGAHKSIISLLVYMFIGIVGLPIFSGGQSGLAVLAGPTGGYVWSYLLVAAVIGAVTGKTCSRFAITAGCMAALLVCYVCGTVQFMMITESDIAGALAVCVYPFVLFDIIKAVCAVAIGGNIRRRLICAGLMQ